MSAHRTWEDLLDEGDRPEHIASDPGANGTVPSLARPSGRLADELPGDGEAPPLPASPPPVLPVSASTATQGSRGNGLRRDLIENLAGEAELPADVLALVDEYERAERRLKQLTGQLPPDPPDAREAARFPLKVHSAASRLEERRLAALEEQRSIGRKRVQERRALAARTEQARREAARVRRDAARQAVLQARTVEERAREHRAAQAARVAVIERDRARWEDERRRALEAACLARRELSAHAERSLDRVRARGIEANRAARREERRDEERRARALARRRGETSHV